MDINTDIVEKIISAVSEAGIPCFGEYPREYVCGERAGAFTAFAGIRKLTLGNLRAGVSDMRAEVRVTVQSCGADGEEVMSAARKTVIPAVLGSAAEIYSAEISGITYDAKTDAARCEIIFEIRSDGYDVCSG